MFDSISTLAVASNMRELYRLVLVDTPLAPYFAESLTSGPHALSLAGSFHSLPVHNLGNQLEIRFGYIAFPPACKPRCKRFALT